MYPESYMAGFVTNKAPIITMFSFVFSLYFLKVIEVQQLQFSASVCTKH